MCNLLIPISCMMYTADGGSSVPNGRHHPAARAPPPQGRTQAPNGLAHGGDPSYGTADAYRHAHKSALLHDSRSYQTRRKSYHVLRFCMPAAYILVCYKTQHVGEVCCCPNAGTSMRTSRQHRPRCGSSRTSGPGSHRRRCGTTATASESWDKTPTANLTKTTQMASNSGCRLACNPNLSAVRLPLLKFAQPSS